MNRNNVNYRMTADRKVGMEEENMLKSRNKGRWITMMMMSVLNIFQMI